MAQLTLLLTGNPTRYPTDAEVTDLKERGKKWLNLQQT